MFLSYSFPIFTASFFANSSFLDAENLFADQIMEFLNRIHLGSLRHPQKSVL